MSAGKGRRKSTSRPPASAKRWRPERRSWCVDEPTQVCDGVDCMSVPIDILATAGVRVEHDTGGVRVGAATLYAETTGDDSHPGVHLRVAGPTGLGENREAWVSFAPDEARELAAELLAHADLVESL